MSYVLGVDAGGSKTLCAVARVGGEVEALGRGGAGNWQGPGIAAAREAVGQAIAAALEAAGIGASDLSAAYFGMAGADRPADFARVRELLQPIAPGERWDFENDATIAMRARVPQGAGIGVICGSGTNVVGFDARGTKAQIGGFGFPFGDSAGAGHIGMLAMRHAWRALDGRGTETGLVALLERQLELQTLSDSIELHYEGRIPWGSLAPLVFQAAEEGDQVARDILVHVAEELAVAADAAWRQLFGDTEPAIEIVAAGSVFQRPRYPLLFDTFAAELVSRHPRARVERLAAPPVLGAVHGALTLAGFEIDEGDAARYGASLERLERKEVGSP